MLFSSRYCTLKFPIQSISKAPLEIFTAEKGCVCNTHSFYYVANQLSYYYSLAFHFIYSKVILNNLTSTPSTQMRITVGNKLMALGRRFKRNV